MSTVFVSGQVGVDEHKALAGDGSLAAQTERAFDNLARALESAGAALADVTKLTIYVVGYQPDHAEVIGPVLGKRFPPGRLPACSLIGVQALARREFLIEIDAIAVVS
jgi:enamine deaminase RidA (YjgF/YER057c/UK114 family)